MWKFLIVLVIVLFINTEMKALPYRRSRMRRNAYRNESRLWPKAVVPFTIDTDYSAKERSVIFKAMKDIQSASCVRFKKRTTEKAFLEIVRGKGCRAVVGYIGRQQKLTLGYGCIWLARVLHELLHVLGFFHEHTRPDRDDFVHIYNDNIKGGSLNNFRKMSEAKVTTFGLPYDYKSVLHYHDREFAVDRSKKTIEPKIGSPVIGKADKLSKMDELKLNKLYHCARLKKIESEEEEEEDEDDEEEEGSGLTELENNFIVVGV